MSLIPSLSDYPTTFEVAGARVVSGQFTGIVLVLYHLPGSAAVLFYDELAAILDCFVVYRKPIYLAGDFNIRLDRADDPHAVQFRLLIESYGLQLHNTSTTHRLGGTLDAVTFRSDAGCPQTVPIVDIGLSDHHLLQWTINTARQVPCHPWRRLDFDQFQSALSSSRLCQSNSWPDDVDEMASVYAYKLSSVLDWLIPAREIVRRPHHSDRGSTVNVPFFEATDASARAPVCVIMSSRCFCF